LNEAASIGRFRVSGISSSGVGRNKVGPLRSNKWSTTNHHSRRWFGGLATAKALSKAPAEIILIDRTNHHFFQPLLYQVATSVLAPSQIGFPIRGIFQKQRNTTVIEGEVTGVDKDKKCVFVSD
jgi:hypothetical protein